MTIHEVCKFYGLPHEVALALNKAGIKRVFPFQEACLSAGAMDGESLVIAAPTASGKTLVVEFAMLAAILRRGGHCLYIVPLRALASEKYNEFNEKYSQLGIKVGIATGDFDSVDPRLGQNDILVVTNEKADSLLRHRAPLFDRLSIVVLDEVHLLADPARGPTLEVLVAKLLRRPSLQVLALSATIRNVEEIADWLQAKAVVSDFRPVKLRSGVYLGGKILFADGKTKRVRLGRDPLSSLAIDTVQEGGQVLIFVYTRRSAESVAKKLAPSLRKILSEKDAEELGLVAGKIEGALPEPTRACKELGNCVRSGVAFHHAGLHPTQRRTIEVAFKAGLLRIVCTTTTLAFGVNLPARRVIIRDVHRGADYIPTLEFHQMAGRAGRPGLDPYGEAILIAKGEDDRDELFLRYILAPPERIASQLGASGAFTSHALSCVASGYASTFAEILSLFSLTFFAHQFGVKELEQAILLALELLHREGMIVAQNGKLRATPFGELVSRLYIDPLSAIILRDGLMRREELGVRGRKKKEPTDLALLHLISHTPDMEKVALRGKDLDELETIRQSVDWLVPVPSDRDYALFLSEIKTACVLAAWIDEEREDKICERYGIGPGDLHRLVENAEWLLYSAQRIGKLLRIRDRELLELRMRMRYGVREELLELVKLRGIGRVRARALYESGFRRLLDIQGADEKTLAQVPYLGPELAQSIKSQIRDGMIGTEWR